MEATGRGLNMELQELRALLDYDPASGVFTWKAKPARRIVIGSVAGGANNFGGWHYVVISVAKKPYLAHRLAWFHMTGEWPDGEIDHRNGDGLDNRWDNLRQATRGQNAQNMRIFRNNTSGYPGVSRLRNGWRAEICAHGVKQHLGLFDTAEAAAAAYLTAKAIQHEFQPRPREARS